MLSKDSLTWLREYWPDILTGLALLAAMIVASVMMLSNAGCASTRIDPASNSAKVETERTPATKTTRITIGGTPVPAEAK